MEQNNNEILHLEAEEVSIDTQINDTLVKANVTDALIANLEEKYSELKLESLNDRDSYEIIKAARKDCKNWRVMAGKICKAGREDANRIAQAWINKENEVCGKIKSIESKLEEQEKAFEAEKERVKKEYAEKVNRQWLARSLELAQMGATIQGDWMILEDVQFNINLIRESEDDIYLNDIKPSFQEIYDRNQADIAANEEKQRLQREEFERQQRELKEQREEMERLEKIRAIQLEAIQKENELLQASDKEKWASIVNHLGKIPNYQMASAQYRSKMKKLKDCLTELNISLK